MKIKNILIMFLITFVFLLGCSKGSRELHHLLPQEFRSQFEKAGVDVDKYTLELSRDTHQKIHKLKWNEEWQKFFEKNPNPTKSEIEKQLNKMLQKYNFKGKFDFYDYKTRKKTGESTSVNDNWIIKICTWIGTLLITIFGNSPLIAFLAAIGSTIFGFFGFSVPHPATVGCGCITVIIGIFAIIGIIVIIF
jgi:hypothetical protein